MAKLVAGTEKLTLKSALAGKNFDNLVGQDSLSALTRITNAFKSIAATLLDTFGGPVADFLEKFTGPDGLRNIKLQLVELANMVIDTFNAGREFLNFFRFGANDKELARRMTLDEQGNIVRTDRANSGDPVLEKLLAENDRQRFIRKNNPRDSVLASTTSTAGTNQSSLLTTGGGGGQNVNVNITSQGVTRGKDLHYITTNREITGDAGYSATLGGNQS